MDHLDVLGGGLEVGRHGHLEYRLKYLDPRRQPIALLQEGTEDELVGAPEYFDDLMEYGEGCLVFRLSNILLSQRSQYAITLLQDFVKFVSFFVLDLVLKLSEEAEEGLAACERAFVIA